ncbi:hypothetical protein [Streptomyces sp. NPDC020983]|uniref:hypothetical protein n=1 Tax=Streptomyces sp. NPDC020983 TaxID=3365106 RepID=UPI0037981736
MVLQGSVGNQVVARMVQRAKTDADRAGHQRRITMGRTAVGQLAGLVKRQLKDHIFNGTPMTGNVDKQRPQGLHAYTNGRLPRGIVATETVGNENKVHVLKWRYASQQTNPKASTMFPRWMGTDEVSALIALEYPDTMTQQLDVGALPVNTGPNVAGGETRPITRSDIETHILRGARVNLAKSGDTVYPTHPAFAG